MSEPKNTAVLISGNGSNLQALIDASAKASYPAKITLVISNEPDAFGLKRAEKSGIETLVINHRDFENKVAFNDAMHQAMVERNIELVCLAGFMRLLSPGFVEQWHNRMLNIHPSLLPSFKGLHAIEQAFNAGVKITGCTVHVVRALMDTGPIIAQAAVEVRDDDTTESLAQRIHAEEHRIYPQALAWLASGALEISDAKVRLISG